MKTKLILTLVVAFISTARADKQADDYWQFEKWLVRVQQEAPRHGLKLHFGDEAEQEFFYLYCWQSSDHSIIHAIQTAKNVWRTKAVPWRERIVKNDNTYDQWMDWYNALPREARRFPGADKAYWRQWFERGFSPSFAWKNTDPKREHTFSRPLLRWEKGEGESK